MRRSSTSNSQRHRVAHSIPCIPTEWQTSRTQTWYNAITGVGFLDPCQVLPRQIARGVRYHNHQLLLAGLIGPVGKKSSSALRNASERMAPASPRENSSTPHTEYMHARAVETWNLPQKTSKTGIFLAKANGTDAEITLFVGDICNMLDTDCEYQDGIMFHVSSAALHMHASTMRCEGLVLSEAGCTRFGEQPTSYEKAKCYACWVNL